MKRQRVGEGFWRLTYGNHRNSNTSKAFKLSVERKGYTRQREQCFDAKTAILKDISPLT